MATSRLSTLTLKITVPIALIAALTIALTVFLNHGKFERTLTELESARVGFVVNDIKANLETGLGLGLALKELANAQNVIDFEAHKDASILSIVIFDETGAVIFHAGRDPGAAIPTAWRPFSRGHAERNWQIADTNALVVGANLSSAIGTPAGGIALQYSRRTHGEVVDSVATSLRLASAIIIAVTVLAAFVGVHFLVAHTDRKLQHIEDLLDPASLSSPEPLRKQEDSETMVLVAGVLQSSRAALRDLSMESSASPSGNRK